MFNNETSRVQQGCNEIDYLARLLNQIKKPNTNIKTVAAGISLNITIGGAEQSTVNHLDLPPFMQKEIRNDGGRFNG